MDHSYYDRLAIQTEPQAKQNGKILGMRITINSIEMCTDIPDCIPAEEIMLATLDDDHLGMLSKYVLYGWPSTKAAMQVLQPYWSSRDETAIIDGIVMKGRRIIVPLSCKGTNWGCCSVPSC